MSMIFEMVGLTPGQIAALCASPSLASDILAVAQNDSGETQRKAILDRLPPEKRAQAEERFRAMESNPRYLEGKKEIAQARERLAAIGPLEPALDLQKSWHILHYALTGSVMPVGSPGDTLLTGQDIGSDTTGYGPPRLQGADATRDFANFLKSIELDKLQQRIDYQEMSQLGVYSMPMGPGSDSEYTEDLRRELASYVPPLKDYIAKMAEKQNGLLMWLT